METIVLVETRQPRITKELPGPKARALIKADRRVASPSLLRVYPLAADHAEGCMVTDVGGNSFLDFAAGIAVCAPGHCHPRVVTEEAVSQMIPSSSPHPTEWPKRELQLIPYMDGSCTGSDSRLALRYARTPYSLGKYPQFE